MTRSMLLLMSAVSASVFLTSPAIAQSAGAADGDGYAETFDSAPVAYEGAPHHPCCVVQLTDQDRAGAHAGADDHRAWDDARSSEYGRRESETETGHQVMIEQSAGDRSRYHDEESFGASSTTQVFEQHEQDFSRFDTGYAWAGHSRGHVHRTTDRDGYLDWSGKSDQVGYRDGGHDEPAAACPVTHGERVLSCRYIPFEPVVHEEPIRINDESFAYDGSVGPAFIGGGGGGGGGGFAIVGGSSSASASASAYASASVSVSGSFHGGGHYGGWGGHKGGWGGHKGGWGGHKAGGCGCSKR